jgi:hypothetical protein
MGMLKILIIGLTFGVFANVYFTPDLNRCFGTQDYNNKIARQQGKQHPDEIIDGGIKEQSHIIVLDTQDR